MKKILSTAFGLLLVAAAEAVPIDLSAVRVSVAQPKNASVALAAQELEKHLALIAGRRQPSPNGVEIVLGASPAGEAAPAAFTSHGRFAGGRLYFWGDDAICEPGPGYRQQNYGTLFAVYGFLQDVLGICWVEPGDDGIVYKTRRQLELKDGWSSFFEPKMMLSYVRTAKDFAEWSYLDENAPPFLRMDRALAEKRLADRQIWMLRMRHIRRKRFRYGHAFTHWQDRFLKTHPEYLALSEKGERGLPWATTFEKSKRSLLCVSNEAVADQIIGEWKESGAPEFLNVSPNDSDLYCHCENCCAWDEPEPGESFGAHKSDRYVRFWNRVIAKAKAVRPDVKVVSYLYAGYRFPPRKVRIESPDNFIGGIVPSEEEDSGKLIAGWCRAGLRMFFIRPNYLCYKGSMPRGYERFLVDDFKRNLRDGMIGVDEDNYPRAITFFETYAISRVIADNDISFERIEREFLSQYGAAAPEMREYYARVRARGEKGRLAAVARGEEARRTGKKPVLDDSMLFGTVLGAHLEPDLDGDLAVIDRALARKSLTEAERRRIRRTRDIVEHAKRVRRFVFARDAGDPKAFEAAAVDVLEWRFAHKDTLGESNWGRLFRGQPMEVRWWMKFGGKEKDRFWKYGTEKEAKK